MSCSLLLCSFYFFIPCSFDPSPPRCRGWGWGMRASTRSSARRHCARFMKPPAAPGGSSRPAALPCASATTAAGITIPCLPSTTVHPSEKSHRHPQPSPNPVFWRSRRWRDREGEKRRLGVAGAIEVKTHEISSGGCINLRFFCPC